MKVAAAILAAVEGVHPAARKERTPLQRPTRFPASSELREVLSAGLEAPALRQAGGRRYAAANIAHAPDVVACPVR